MARPYRLAGGPGPLAGAAKPGEELVMVASKSEFVFQTAAGVIFQVEEGLQQCPQSLLTHPILKDRLSLAEVVSPAVVDDATTTNIPDTGKTSRKGK